MREQCGTPAYIAPEILRDKGYKGFKMDLWSAGVCLYAMLMGTVPFKGNSMHELHKIILEAKYEYKEKISPQAQDLIAKLLETDQNLRLSAKEVLQHEWLAGVEESFKVQTDKDVFSQKERDQIYKEFLRKDPLNKRLEQEDDNLYNDTDPYITEYALDTKNSEANCDLLKNNSTKSVILAPFNSTFSDKDSPFDWSDSVKELIVPRRCLKFAPRCKDLNRQYEQNNNDELDNGVYNDAFNDEDEEEGLLGEAKENH